MDSRNRLLHLLVFYYNGAHHGIAVCLNVMALAVLGASWRKIGKSQDVRLPYFMSIFICGLNIIFLISVELPKLYSEWTEEPNLFSVRVCLYLSVAVPISEVAQTIVIMWAIVGISHRQRLVSRFSSNLGGGHCHRILALLCAAFLHIAILGMSRAYQPQIGRSATLQELTLVRVPCHLNLPSIWTISFRWVLVLYLPMILIVVPLALHLRIKLWPRCCSPTLQSYIVLFEAVMFINILLQLPSFILDVVKMKPLEELSFLILNPQNIEKLGFCSQVISRVLPKLQFSYMPIGVIVVLPWKTKDSRRHGNDLVERSFLFRQMPKKCTLMTASNEEQELKMMLDNSPTSDV